MTLPMSLRECLRRRSGLSGDWSRTLPVLGAWWFSVASPFLFSAEERRRCILVVFWRIFSRVNTVKGSGDFLLKLEPEKLSDLNALSSNQDRSPCIINVGTEEIFTRGRLAGAWRTLRPPVGGRTRWVELQGLRRTSVYFWKQQKIRKNSKSCLTFYCNREVSIG